MMKRQWPERGPTLKNVDRLGQNPNTKGALDHDSVPMGQNQRFFLRAT